MFVLLQAASVAAALPVSIAVMLIAIGMVYSIVTITLQRKISNPKKMKEIQAKIKALTKEMNEMAKRKENIAEKQKELMPLMKESMKTQMKSMIIVLPVFLLIYYGALPLLFGSYAGQQINIVIPFTYSGLFFYTAFIMGILITIGILIRDKLQSRKSKPLQPTVGGGSEPSK